MSDGKHHLCIRCGIAVHDKGASCNDCRRVDLELIEKWRKSA